MVNENAALSHHLFEVTQAQGIGKVPANALGDDINGVMESFEGFSDQRHGWLLEKIRGILPAPFLNATEPWKYLYRAVYSSGQTIDFLLTAKRDAAAALRFFRKAISQHGEPEVVTIDKSGANTAALAALNAGKSKDNAITVRQQKYLNNLVEQDHRNIKQRIRPMLGFKSFRRAQGGAGRYRGCSDDSQRAISTS